MKQENIILPHFFLEAYSQGIFPMAESKHHDKIIWIKPKKRGIIPIGNLHISKSLKKKIKRNNFYCSINKEFNFILTHCSNREETWINETLKNSYIRLFNLGFCHSIEIWEKKEIIGGLFGVVLGSCFFAESMFSLKNDGSKIALVSLMARLVEGNFQLLDTQFSSSHLNSMGGVEISQKKYEIYLKKNIELESNFFKLKNNDDWGNQMQLASTKSYLG